jgi:hypothetical protein
MLNCSETLRDVVIVKEHVQAITERIQVLIKEATTRGSQVALVAVRRSYYPTSDTVD